MSDAKNKSFKQPNNLTISAETIQTIRLHLRQPIAKDFVALRHLWLDVKVRQFLGGIISKEEVEGKIDSIQDHWKQHGFGQFAVYENNDNQIIGICGLHYSEDDVEISYMFFPVFWDRGFATEAVMASLNYGFNILKLKKIIAITQDANRRSWQLLEKIGMHFSDTVWRFDAFQRVYKLTQSEWLVKYRLETYP